MIAERLIFPSSKLAHTRHWHDTTLAEELDIADATEDHLYDTMDWLLLRQKAIEKKLARRHLGEGAMVLYDVTSSYYEGKTCPLARFGYDRDGKTGCPIIVYGMLTDADGRPVAVQVYPGNTGDPKTVPDQVEALTKRFGLAHVVLVGDRGMLTQTQIDVLKKHPGLGWISACVAARSAACWPTVSWSQRISCPYAWLRSLPQTSPANGWWLATTPSWPSSVGSSPGIACGHPGRTGGMAASVARPGGPPEKAADIGVRAGKIINHYKMSKHFSLTIRDGHLGWARKADHIKNEELLDGIYVVRTNEPTERLAADNGVRSTSGWPWWSKRFDVSKGLTSWCGRFTTAQQTGGEPTSCSACWLSTWSGTCGRCGNRSCSRTRS